VHLLISSLLMMNGYVKLSQRLAILNTVVTIYLFLVIAAYTRAGMVVFLTGWILFFVYTKSKDLKAQLLLYLKYAPVFVFIAISLYLSTKLQENFQGRKVGFEQLKQNAVSIVTENGEGGLSDNKAWRLIWWVRFWMIHLVAAIFLLGVDLV